MTKLNNYKFLEKILLNLLCRGALILILFSAKIVYSQSNSSQKELSSKNVSSDIKVSKLAKPSLGSLGINTDVNNLIGINIWQDMQAQDIIEHLNYLPDILPSRHLQFFLNDIYLSTSVPPKGKSDEILKFLETRLFKIKNSGQSHNLYKLVSQLPDGERWEIWRRWKTEYELINRQDKKACQLIKEVSKMARIDDYISTLDFGYNTRIGEQGITLSGGQQQRIAIARALYRKSSILIFDEATSALDYKTEDFIMESISNLSKIDSLTIMIIAHRLNTLDQCDSIYKIEKGSLIKTK